MKFDYHIHSSHSDGVLDVSSLISLAREKQLQQMSITDHDTLAAYDELSGCFPSDLRLIPGCEFSAVWRGRTVHLVGLNLALDSAAMIMAMGIQKNARKVRAEIIAGLLEAKGFLGALAGAKSFASSADNLGRPHFAAFLEAEGYVKDQRQAFKKYLGAGKPGDVKAQWLDIGEVISWIVESGGVAVVAHPLKYGLTHTKLREFLADFKDAGGQAIEVISGAQDPSRTAQIAKLAESFDFFASAGSDFHRPDQRWAQLGHVAPLPSYCRPVWQLWS